MILEINDKWRVTTDQYQFILQKVSGAAQKPQHGTKRGAPLWRAITYHQTLGGLVRELLRRELIDPKHSALTQALETQESLVAKLSLALPRINEVTVREVA